MLRSPHKLREFRRELRRVRDQKKITAAAGATVSGIVASGAPRVVKTYVQRRDDKAAAKQTPAKRQTGANLSDSDNEGAEKVYDHIRADTTDVTKVAANTDSTPSILIAA